MLTFATVRVLLASRSLRRCPKLASQRCWPALEQRRTASSRENCETAGGELSSQPRQAASRLFPAATSSQVARRKSGHWRPSWLASSQASAPGAACRQLASGPASGHHRVLQAAAALTQQGANGAHRAKVAAQPGDPAGAQCVQLAEAGNGRRIARRGCCRAQLAPVAAFELATERLQGRTASAKPHAWLWVGGSLLEGEAACLQLLRVSVHLLLDADRVRPLAAQHAPLQVAQQGPHIVPCGALRLGHQPVLLGHRATVAAQLEAAAVAGHAAEGRALAERPRRRGPQLPGPPHACHRIAEYQRWPAAAGDWGLRGWAQPHSRGSRSAPEPPGRPPPPGRTPSRLGSLPALAAASHRASVSEPSHAGRLLAAGACPAAVDEHIDDPAHRAAAGCAGRSARCAAPAGWLHRVQHGGQRERPRLRTDGTASATSLSGRQRVGVVDHKRRRSHRLLLHDGLVGQAEGALCAAQPAEGVAGTQLREGRRHALERGRQLGDGGRLQQAGFLSWLT